MCLINYIQNNKLKFAKWVKTIIFDLCEAIESIIAFSYFINAFYTAETVEKYKEGLTVEQYNAKYNKNITDQYVYHYNLFKKGSSPGPGFDIKSCANFSREEADLFHTLENQKVISAVEFWLSLLIMVTFDIHTQASNGGEQQRPSCFQRFNNWKRKSLMKLLFIPGVILIDSIDYTTHCIQRSILINSHLMSFIYACNFLIIFVIFELIGNRFNWSCKCLSDRRRQQADRGCFLFSSYYFLFAFVLYFVNFASASPLAILISSTITIDVLINILFGFLESFFTLTDLPIVPVVPILPVLPVVSIS